MFLSKLKEGNILETVAPVLNENLVDCFSSVTIDESVLETDKTKRFVAQGWDAFEKQSVLRSSVEGPWFLSYRSAEPPTIR